MAKYLLVVESPAKSRTIGKYLGKDYVIKASMGHVVDLPQKEFGIEVDKDFKAKYIVMPGKQKIIKELKDAAKKAEKVFLAPDPDREGEAIAYHVAQLMNKHPYIKRITFNEITKSAVTRAIEKPMDLNVNLVNAQQARRILDRIVGYRISPILWKTLYRGLSAGRVQSVALKMICERDEEIANFKSQEYWTLDVDLKAKAGRKFKARLVKVDGKKAELPSEEIVSGITSGLKDETFTVATVSKKEKLRSPYPPFITSTLQQEAARRFHFSATKTMMIAQQLYEGIELGDREPVGLITYMRTDSTRVSDEAQAAAKSWITNKYGQEYVPAKKKVFKKKAGAQDAHEAVRPTQISAEFEPENLERFLKKDQLRIYQIIWKRFVASQMANCVFDSTTVEITAGNAMFRVYGQVEKFPGFRKEYDEKREEKETEDKELILPVLEENENLKFQEWDPQQHFTQPPASYTEAMLVKELEAKGIGRPSTYAQIINTLRKRKYVTMEKRRFSPSDIGKTVNSILVKQFPEIINIEFTAKMENQLDEVEAGHVDWLKLLNDFYTPFSKKISEANENASEIKASLREDSGEKCEKCGKAMVIKWGRNGKFKACSGYPDCMNTKPIGEDAKVEVTGEKCPKCGADLVLRSTFKGRFIGCSAFPTCRYIQPVSTGVKCPKEGCGGDLVEKRTRRGKTFYGCGSYPACSYAVWNKPVAKKCPECAHPIMVEKTSKAKGDYLSCPECKAKLQSEEG